MNRPGSLPWLLRHDLLLAWRELTAATSPATLILTLVLAWGALHSILWALLRRFQSPDGNLPEGAILAGTLLLAFAVPLILSFAIGRCVRAVYERADFDLLVSSPISGRVVLASRTLGVAVQVFVISGIFLLPIGSIGVIVGLPQLLGIVPSLLAISLGCSAAGIILTLWLVRLVGARRARTVAQIIGGLTGAGLFLLTQIPVLTGTDWQANLPDLLNTLALHMQPGGLLAPESLLLLPGRALFFDPLAVIVLLAAGAGLIWLTSATMHRQFISSTQATVTDTRRRRPQAAGGIRFRQGGLFMHVLKEWKLILRDPYLVSQTLLQLLFIVPLVFVIIQSRNSPGAIADFHVTIAASVVMLGGVLVAVLARISFSGEEALDLLRASPTPPAVLRRAKILAAIVPVLALLLPATVWLAFTSPFLALLTAGVLLVSSLNVAIIRLWNPARFARADLFKRQSQGDVIMATLEGLIPVSWAAAVLGTNIGQMWGYYAIGVAIAAAGLAYWRSTTWETSFGY